MSLPLRTAATTPNRRTGDNPVLWNKFDALTSKSFTPVKTLPFRRLVHRLRARANFNGMWIEVYSALSVGSLFLAALALRHECKKKNIKLLWFAVSGNALVYYKEVRRRGEKPSGWFVFYLVAAANLLLCFIMWVAHALWST